MRHPSQSSQDVRSIYNEKASQWIEHSKIIPDVALPSLTRFSEFVPSHGRVLDVGCGSGVYSDWFMRHDFNVLAIDISDKLVAYVKNTYPDLSVIRGEIYDVDQKSFDGIWCYLVFHHIPTIERKRFMSVLSSLLATSGVLCITVALDKRVSESTCTNGALKATTTIKQMEGLFRTNHLEILHSNEWANGMMEYLVLKL